MALLVGDDDIRAADGFVANLQSRYTHTSVSSGTDLSIGHSIRVRDNKSGRTTSNTLEASLKSYGHSGCSWQLLVRFYDPDDDQTRDHYLYLSVRQLLPLWDDGRLMMHMSTRIGPEKKPIDQTRLAVEIRVEI